MFDKWKVSIQLNNIILFISDDLVFFFFFLLLLKSYVIVDVFSESEAHELTMFRTNFLIKSVSNNVLRSPNTTATLIFFHRVIAIVCYKTYLKLSY